MPVHVIEKPNKLDPGEKRRLQNGIARRVYQFTENNEGAALLFRELYRDLRNWFGVEKYTEIEREDLQAAISFIEMWTPRKVS